LGILSSSGRRAIGPKVLDALGDGNGRTVGPKIGGVGVAVGLGVGLGVSDGVGVGDGINPPPLEDGGEARASPTTISICEVTVAPPVPVMVTVIV
jgi:hypothetical protein